MLVIFSFQRGHGNNGIKSVLDKGVGSAHGFFNLIQEAW